VLRMRTGKFQRFAIFAS